jgi:hypothetical protein
MRDEDKPFVLYRTSRWEFKIVPRGRKGWLALIIWNVLALPMILGFSLYLIEHPAGPAFAIGIALFVIAMTIWAVGGIWWMKARAEVVDVAELLKLKHEAERKRRGGR